MNDQSRYIVDSRYFDGTCLTFMTDGFRSDFGGETLEEMRVRENNPYLTSVTRQRIDKMLHLYLQALSAPFSEITKEEYHDLMDVLPPIRLEKDSFFVGEPYYGEVYTFCFTRKGRYFKGLRSEYTSRTELDRQIARHMETVNRKAAILKDRPDNAGLTSYYFSLEGKQPVFICNLIIGSDSRQARTDMACTLKSLRKNHYLFYKGKGKYETPEELFTEVSRNKLTLISDEHFFQYPRNRESVTFVARIKQTAGEFLFRIYDREYFLYLLKRLRTVKRESTRETANIKS